MRRILSLTLTFIVVCAGLVPLCIGTARAQEVASVGTIVKLREQYERLLAIEHDPATSPEVREMNHPFLEERRTQLATALRTRIGTLRKYQGSAVMALTDDEKRAIEGSIQKLIDELETLQPGQDDLPKGDARPSRVVSKAPQPKQVVHTSYRDDGEKSDASEPAPDPRPARRDDPIEITSPDRDKTVHVSEIEIEVSLNDVDIDDIMVAVYTPASAKPVTARSYDVKPSYRGKMPPTAIKLSKGENRIEVSARHGEVKTERKLTFTPPDTPALGATDGDAADGSAGGDGAAAGAAAGGGAAAANAVENVPEYDWGRVRAYFAGGTILSKAENNFSKSDIFLDFTLDKNYLASGKRKVFKDFNTFFDARLTTIPIAQPSPAPGATATATPSPTPTCNTPDCANFITSQKAALMQVGIYLPMYGKYTSWLREVPDVTSVRQDKAKGTTTTVTTTNYEKNALFIAPLVKGGIQTITGDRQTAEGQRFGGDDVFNFFSFGTMLGHFRIPTRRVECKPDDNDDSCIRSSDASNKSGGYRYVRNTNIAPELISWLTLSVGRWESFEITVPTGQKDKDNNDITVRRRPWRYEALGRLKIPNLPFIVGFDGNFGKGPDDLRFIFGTRFDIGKVFSALSAGQAAKKSSDTAPSPNATDTSKSSKAP
jgi:hypothetical protein